MADASENDRTPVQASEPVAGSAADQGAGSALPHGTNEKSDETLDPQEAEARANAIDETTASDGVAFFEGGEPRGGEQSDVERSG